MFITLEGVDCSGKTTAISQIEAYFKKHGVDCLVTREPGGTEFGESLRGLLLHSKEHFNRHTELLLFMAARSHHIENVIRPALQNDIVVVCDRFVDSSLVYQSTSISDMFELNDWCNDYSWLIEPDYVLYFKVSASVVLSRMSQSFKDKIEERLDSNTINGYIDKYNALAEYKKFLTIDANLKQNFVQEQVLTLMNERVVNCDH